MTIDTVLPSLIDDNSLVLRVSLIDGKYSLGVSGDVGT